MNEGVWCSLITRCSDQAASSAVSGLPLWKTMPSRTLNVKVLPSSAICQLSATWPRRSATSSTGYVTRRSYTFAAYSAPVNSNASAGSSVIRSAIWNAMTRVS